MTDCPCGRSSPCVQSIEGSTRTPVSCTTTPATQSAYLEGVAVGVGSRPASRGLMIVPTGWGSLACSSLVVLGASQGSFAPWSSWQGRTRRCCCSRLVVCRRCRAGVRM